MPRIVKCGHAPWGGTLGTGHCKVPECYNSIDKCVNHKHLNTPKD